MVFGREECEQWLEFYGEWIKHLYVWKVYSFGSHDFTYNSKYDINVKTPCSFVETFVDGTTQHIRQNHVCCSNVDVSGREADERAERDTSIRRNGRTGAIKRSQTRTRERGTHTRTPQQ